MRRTGILGAFVIVLMVAACSGDGQSTATPSTAPTNATAGTEAPPPTATNDPTTTAGSETEEVPPDLLLAGLQTIELTSAPSGGGIRPELAWDPLEGAGHYVVYLYDPSGDVYWSWQGAETSVPVGGRPQLPDDASGPSVVDGMTWAVVAYDADQLPIGSSRLGSISP